jgi:hypothetical protein
VRPWWENKRQGGSRKRIGLGRSGRAVSKSEIYPKGQRGGRRMQWGGRGKQTGKQEEGGIGRWSE